MGAGTRDGWLGRHSGRRVAMVALAVLAGWVLGAGLEGPGPAGLSRLASRAGMPSDPHAIIRGMTISCPEAGQIWGTDAMVATLRELKAMGINWVAIHPYAGIRADGTVGVWSGLYERPTWLTRPIEEAHRLGLKIMIKPHLAYWGSGFSWRGAITFESEAAWARFFATYGAWVQRVARLSREADAFVVGTELDQTTHRQAAWRGIIQRVRQVHPGLLTYAANWDSFERIPFWDGLDAVGIQGYFPLVDHEALPSQAELDRSWRILVARLEAFGQRKGRKVFLSELGYNLSSEAAIRPWATHSRGPSAARVQRRAMAAALKALDGSTWVAGAFLWKWFPSEDHGHREDFLMSTPAMRGVIREHWGLEGRGVGDGSGG